MRKIIKYIMLPAVLLILTACQDKEMTKNKITDITSSDIVTAKLVLDTKADIEKTFNPDEYDILLGLLEKLDPEVLTKSEEQLSYEDHLIIETNDKSYELVLDDDQIILDGNSYELGGISDFYQELDFSQNVNEEVCLTIATAYKISDKNIVAYSSDLDESISLPKASLVGDSNVKEQDRLLVLANCSILETSPARFQVVYRIINLD